MKTLEQVEPRKDVQKLSGDASSLFVIIQPGSYYLSANINGSSGRNGINIQADFVTLDLNGFTVTGAVGALRGIVISGARRNIAVRNGSVQNWPSDGVDLSAAIGSAVSDLLVFGNGGIGISAGDTGLVSACVSRQNVGDSIRVGAQSVITKCTA